MKKILLGLVLSMLSIAFTFILFSVDKTSIKKTSVNVIEKIEDGYSKLFKSEYRLSSGRNKKKAMEIRYEKEQLRDMAKKRRNLETRSKNNR